MTNEMETEKKPETYSDIKHRHQKEFDELSKGLVFYAFSKEQFAEGCERINAEKNEQGKWKLVCLGAGGYAKHEFLEKFDAFNKRCDEEIKAFHQQEKNLIDALIYEFGNYECQIAPENKVTAVEHATNGHPELATTAILNKAWRKFWNDCVKNNWF